MLITIKFFAALKETLGPEIKLETQEQCDLAQLKTLLMQKFPQQQALFARSSFAIDQQYASDETCLATEQEIAVIPPVSGG